MNAAVLRFPTMTNPIEPILSVRIPFAPQRKRATQAFRSRYGKQIVSDPDRALKAELAEWIAEHAILPAEPFDGAVIASFLFTFEPPKSYSKKLRAKVLADVLAPGVSLDHDNMVKLYQDVLQTGPLEGKIWKDDRQVSIGHTAKVWAEEASVSIILQGVREFSPTLLYPFF